MMQQLSFLYQDITQAAAERYGVTATAIIGDSRQHTVAAARRAAMYLAYRVTYDRCSTIAAHYGREPASFSRAIATVRADISQDADLARWMTRAEQTLAKKFAREHLRPLREPGKPDSDDSQPSLLPPP
jgi:chromosomal replication initiation ATPase DnaA